MSLEDYNRRILKPMVIKFIKAGNFDGILLDPDCIEIILADAELTQAFKDRFMQMVTPSPISKSVEALEELLQRARAKLLDIQRGIEANDRNMADCKSNQSNVLFDIAHLEHQLSILRKI